MFARGFSIEATRPSFAELAELAGILGKTAPVYLSSVPAQSFDELVGVAARVRALGLEPVAHLPARRLASADGLKEFLKRVRGEADMRRLLVIAGDDGAAAGPYKDALAVIASGMLREAGIEEAGVAGYPEGHPKFTAQALEDALKTKIAAAKSANLSLHIVSQFSFDPKAILDWLKRLRASGIDAPVKVGMAGPASLPALIRYAKRCGVRSSVQGLMSGAAAALVGALGSGAVGPDRIVEALRAATGLGDIAPHYFSFGGVVNTARYARDTAEGRAQDERAIKQPN